MEDVIICRECGECGEEVAAAGETGCSCTNDFEPAEGQGLSVWQGRTREQEAASLGVSL